MNTKLLFITVIVLSTACNRSATDSLAKREMFDAKGQEVITSSANENRGLCPYCTATVPHCRQRLMEPADITRAKYLH